MFANRHDGTQHSLSTVLRALALLIRLPNALTAVSNIIAAHLIATAAQPDWQVLLLTIVSSLCFYHGGMVLNDCVDYKEDKRLRPTRPLPSGLISLPLAYGLSAVLLATGLWIAYGLGPSTAWVALALLLAVVAYNLSSREGTLGCIAMAACRLLNWCLGLSVVAGWLVYWPYAVLVGVYVLALTLISRDETLARRVGWVNYSAGVLATGAVMFLLWTWLQGSLSLVALAMMAVAVAFLLFRLIQLKRNYTPDTVQSMVMFLILGLIPLDALLVLIAGYPLAALLLVLLLLPSRWLAGYFYVT